MPLPIHPIRDRATPQPSDGRVTDTQSEPGAELDRGPLVLVVEDNAINRTVVEVLLRKRGLRTAAAQDGREAIAMVASHTYDTILMDCMMPEIDGFTATREIRRDESEHRVPIIAMTAMSMPGDRELCLAAGMDDYLSKPIRRDELDAALDRWLPAQSPYVDDPAIGSGPAPERFGRGRNGLPASSLQTTVIP